jgi:tRNA A-37 threonylcarbamoyl transferase component Bud32
LAAALADRYRIERELGQGGMATVYLAEDLKHERQVAIKVLREDLSASLGAGRFLREIKIAAQLQHPHILPLLDSGEADGFLYFVMPYIKGQSLRERLAREGELPVPEAVRLISEVVDALVEAHAHGVVHRDIKPDNVMLSGRHALVTDFGVAKAISEATGRNTVTTLGVAVGTPAYMSPEQAAADPHVDHRSDIYSVGVMAYEMLSGRPPFTGNTPQQVLAAHVTEAPDPVSKRRPAIPAALEQIVMKCLAKRPADRYQSASELHAALEPLSTPSAGMTPTETRPIMAGRPARRALWLLLPGLGVLGVVAWLMVRAQGHGPAAPDAFRARTQVTSTGNADNPALSADGKQLAYIVQNCTASGCNSSIEVQDVEGTGRRLVDGVSSIVGLVWSADRRFLLFQGTLGNKTGSFLVPTLGGEPRFLGVELASFLWSGDSLLASGFNPPDSIDWIRTETLDGQARDSFRVLGVGVEYAALPGDRWILGGSWHTKGIVARVLDRTGRQNDSLNMPRGSSFPQAGGGAAWFSVPSGGNRKGLVRVAINLRTGMFQPPFDTVLDAADESFDVSGDGRTIAYVDGVRQQELWVMSLVDALQGHFLPEHRLLSSTSVLAGELTPDGTRILVGDSEPGPTGRRFVQSVRPVNGGPSVPLLPPDGATGHSWAVDGSSIIFEVDRKPGIQFVTVDTRTAARTTTFSINDSSSRSWDALPGGGFAWVSRSGNRIRLQRTEQEKPTDVRLPAGEYAFNVNASPDGTRLVAMARAGQLNDTVVINVVSLSDRRVIRWMATSGQEIGANWLADGSLRVVVYETAAATVYRLVGPDQVQRLGTIPRAVAGVAWSRDGRLVSIHTSDLHGDIWLARQAKSKP